MPTSSAAFERRKRNADAKGWHPFLGAHVSIAGGFHRALEAADALGAGAAQIFTKPGSQWRAKPLDPAAVRRFHEVFAELGPFELAVHDSYLINLASVDPELRKKSIDAFLEEIERCEALGIPRLVFHPGSHLGRGETAGLESIADALRFCLEQTAGYRTRLLAENTAGQGSNLGFDLAHLQFLLDALGRPDRLRVCIDTCHLFAAGYDFRTEDAYASLKNDLARTIGLGSIDLFHLNDSKQPFASRKDRHENIGKGEIGPEPFGFFLRDPDFRSVPMVVETPTQGDGHKRDLTQLRRLSKAEPLEEAPSKPAPKPPAPKPTRKSPARKAPAPKSTRKSPMSQKERHS
ncbi:MAG: deoxyribonuclease IV [Candidatus Eisenbacteria bacterium]